MTLRQLVVLTAVLALSGCATKPGECDATNRDSSMLTKMNCDYSGGYSDQVKQKELALSESRQQNAMFRQVYENIQAQQLSTKTDLASQQKSQAALNQSLAQLLTSLKARHGNESPGAEADRRPRAAAQGFASGANDQSQRQRRWRPSSKS